MKMNFPIVAALLIVYIFWGGTYLAMKVAIETFPPYIMAGIRFLTAGVILYVRQSVRGVEKPLVTQWKNAAIFGVIMVLGGNVV